LSTSLGLSWKVIAAAEVLSLPRFAIGSELHDAKAYLEVPDLFAWTLAIIFLSFLFNGALKFYFKRIGKQVLR
jgi:NitT/TauT family transport system permease protein